MYRFECEYIISMYCNNLNINDESIFATIAMYHVIQTSDTMETN
jgi:hypothetical protein